MDYVSPPLLRFSTKIKVRFRIPSQVCEIAHLVLLCMHDQHSEDSGLASGVSELSSLVCSTGFSRNSAYMRYYERRYYELSLTKHKLTKRTEPF